MKSWLAKLGIHDRKSWVDFKIQFLKFGIVGLSNTVLGLAIYYLFLYINKDLYIVGHIVGWFVSVFNAFYWNNKYVFKLEQRNIWKTLLKTYISYGSSFLLATGLLVAQVEWFKISSEIAPIINLIITIPLNFLINKFWTFKE